MPEVLFTVRWPDGGVETCYSPSTIIKNYFQVGRAYPVGEFVEISRKALLHASDRVRDRFGGAGCSRAMGQLSAIEATARRQEDGSASVRIEGFRP